MKNFLPILLLTIVFCANTLKGQNLMIGPKAGFSLSHAFYDDKSYMEDKSMLPRPGFTGGVMVNFSYYKNLSVQTELNFTQRGRTILIKEQQFKHIANYNFVELPVLFKLTFGKEPIQYFINGGPNISYWLRGRGKLSHQDLQEWDMEYFRYKTSFKEREFTDSEVVDFYYDAPNRVQFGIDIGFGTVFQTNRKERCTIELRYLLGHSFMAKTPEYDLRLSNPQDNLMFSTNALTLSAAYTFEFNIFEFYKGKSTYRK